MLTVAALAPPLDVFQPVPGVDRAKMATPAARAGDAAGSRLFRRHLFIHSDSLSPLIVRQFPQSAIPSPVCRWEGALVATSVALRSQNGQRCKWLSGNDLTTLVALVAYVAGVEVTGCSVAWNIERTTKLVQTAKWRWATTICNEEESYLSFPYLQKSFEGLLDFRSAYRMKVSVCSKAAVPLRPANPSPFSKDPRSNNRQGLTYPCSRLPASTLAVSLPAFGERVLLTRSSVMTLLPHTSHWR